VSQKLWNLRGSQSGWLYAVEHFTSRGLDQAVLEGLSASGAAAVLCFTQSVDIFKYADHGLLTAGFDMTVLSSRYGSNPERLDDAMTEAGFGAPGVHRAVAAARLLKSLTGVRVGTQMLEGRLKSYLI
jgi:hypothetical protein